MRKQNQLLFTIQLVVVVVVTSTLRGAPIGRYHQLRAHELVESHQEPALPSVNLVEVTCRDVRRPPLLLLPGFYDQFLQRRVQNFPINRKYFFLLLFPNTICLRAWWMRAPPHSASESISSWTTSLPQRTSRACMPSNPESSRNDLVVYLYIFLWEVLKTHSWTSNS